jgi:hypothetical protein
MNKIQESNPCGRAEQLVSYLYGESGATERARFEQHLAVCAACRDELQAFGQVREAVGAWRAELLANAPGVAAADLLPAAEPRRAFVGAPSRRSAWGALREFFVLSPAWLRFGTVAASLVVCVLAALAIVNAEVGRENGKLVFRTGVWRTSSPKDGQHQNAVDASQLKQLLAEREAMARQLEETRAQLDDSRAANIQAVYDVIDDSAQTDAPVQPSASDQGASQLRRSGGANATRRAARRSTAKEEDLPRLLDLLSSGN